MRIKAKAPSVQFGGMIASWSDVEITDDNGNPINEIVGPITITIPEGNEPITAHFGVYITEIDIDCKEEK